MASVERFPRPKTTADLLEKLYLDRDNDHQNAGTKKESAALHTLSKSMIQTFCQDPSQLYAAEASALCAISQGRPYALETATLSLFTNEDDHLNLLKAFIKCITSDTGTPDGRLLASFGAVLRCAPTENFRKKAQPEYGHVIQHLTELLRRSKADSVTRYKLLCALSELLDVMNEVKFEGIGDAEIAQPLFDLLEDANKHEELRLSQAARYACQALRGIPTDVGPWEKFGKGLYGTIRTMAMIAGSVSTMDPDKFIQGGVKALAQAARLASVIPSIIDELKDARNAYEGVTKLTKPKQWYLALRYTDLLIRGRAPEYLKSLLENPEFPLKQDKNFLCGLCAQLERANYDIDRDDRVIDVLVQFLIQHSVRSKSRRIHQWVQLVIPKDKQPELTEPPKTRIIHSRLLGGPRKYSTAIGREEMLPQTPGDRLLSKAWDECHLAKVFYADQIIRDHYTDEVLQPLKVERVGNNSSLSMDQCYVNLAIVRSGVEEENSDVSRSLSLHHRLAIWEPSGPDRVALRDLQPKPDSDKVAKPFRWRVLIRGQAGVGKSTLCKRIVYNHIYHDMWAETIDRVIWLPLRQLKGETKQEYSVHDLLIERYFRRGHDGLLSDALCKELDNETGKTLFILDGVDEVLHEIPHSSLLQSLLGQRRVIITTRPYALDPNLIRDIDMEVQIVGFYPYQVHQYIEAVEPENAVKIQSFLRSRPVIQELARIPVQLDAFCYSFETGAFQGGEGPRTLTELYCAIEQVIWKKDAVRLERHFHGRAKTITKDEALRSRHTEIRAVIQGEVNVLQALAFDGFCNNKEEFDWEYQTRFWDRIDKLTEHLPKAESSVLSVEFERLSLLRTSDGGAAMKSSYHFLHLTFQEYFAAQYFIQHWPGKLLPELDISAEDFFRKHKYDQRFDLIWRFVAGLLHAQGDTRKFFETIETEPYDLLGPVHQRLVMHCLAEVAQSPYITSDFEKLRDDLEDHLRQWITYELRSRKTSSSLGALIEFPEKILQQLLSDTSWSLQTRILTTLRYRPMISSQMAEHLTSCLGSNSPQLKSEVLQVFSSHPDALAEKYHLEMVNLFDDITAVNVLAKQRVLSDVIFSELMGILRGPDEKRRTDVLHIMTKQHFVSDEVLLIALDSLLDMRISSGLRNSSISYLKLAIATQSAFGLNIIEKLLIMLRDPNEMVWHAAAKIISANDEPNIILRIISIFKDPSQTGLPAAEMALSENGYLPENVIGEIVKLLENSDPNIQSAATNILYYQKTTFSYSILQKLANLLDYPGTQHGASRVLIGQSPLPEQIVQKVLPQYRDPATSHFEIVCKQSGLPEKVLEELVQLLQNPDIKVRSMATEALRIQSAIPDKIVEGLTSLIHSTDITIQYAATEALSAQSSLPCEILSKMIYNLWHHQGDFESIAGTALRRQLTIPPKLLPELVRLLPHPNHEVRRCARNILEHKLDLPDDILREMIHLLSKRQTTHSIKYTYELEILDIIVYIFSKQRHVKEDILQELIPLLENAPGSIFALLSGSFRESSALLEQLSKMIHTTLLNDYYRDKGARDYAARIISENSAISDETFASLLDKMDDVSFIYLYNYWLEESFTSHIVWRVDGNDSIISVGGRDRRVPLDKFKDAVREARASRGVPYQDFGQVFPRKKEGSMIISTCP